MTTATIASPPQAEARRFMAPRPLLALALAIAVILTIAWAVKDWTNLAQLHLPDNDDIARLAQVRDWLAGQGFNDLMQYRLGPPGGASMHWSRIADAGPALLILIFTPLFGTHGAEVAMVVTYPAILFLLYLLLVARVAARLGGEKAGVPALVLAALAFPTISLFVPGRIDHHALQIVLTLVLICTILPKPVRTEPVEGRPSTPFDRLSANGGLWSGALGGLATALSLAIGLEAAPEIIAAMVAIGIAWLTGGKEDDQRAIGIGAALGGTTLALLVFAHPQVWPEQWCDGFTPSSTRATLTLAGAWLLLGLSGRFARDWKPRLGVAAILGGGAALIAWRASPVCFAGPYGALDPFLQHVWMRNVSEARDLFFGQDTIGTSLAYGGLVLAGAALALSRIRDAKWRSFAIFMGLSAIAAVAAVRVTYIMAGLAVIPFAAMLARDGTLAKRLALWVFGAGISWNLIAVQMDAAFAKPIVAAKAVQKSCIDNAAIRIVAAQPSGTIMAPLDLDSYLLGMTPHHVVAGLYHRNNTGNLAMYHFFLAPPGTAMAMAKAQGVTLVAICPDNLHEDGLQQYRPGSLAERLQSDLPPPAWLEPVPTGSAIRLYRVR